MLEKETIAKIKKNNISDNLSSYLSSTKKLIHIAKELNTDKNLFCPKCRSTNFVKFGKFNGKQRYCCKSCKKTFNELTETPFNRTRNPGKWIEFINELTKTKTLKESSEAIGTSYVTILSWRHKLLKYIKIERREKLEGIVEAKEIYISNSRKGCGDIYDRDSKYRGEFLIYGGIKEDQSCVLALKDRNGNVILENLCQGRIERKSIENKVGQYLDRTNVLCSNLMTDYAQFSKHHKIKHFRFGSANSEISGKFHIKTVTEYMKNLKKWLNRFRGVSSKYLENYLSWFEFLEKVKNIVV